MSTVFGCLWFHALKKKKFSYFEVCLCPWKWRWQFVKKKSWEKKKVDNTVYTWFCKNVFKDNRFLDQFSVKMRWCPVENWEIKRLRQIAVEERNYGPDFFYSAGEMSTNHRVLPQKNCCFKKQINCTWL